MLKVNQTLTSVKYAATHPFSCCQQPLTPCVLPCWCACLYVRLLGSLFRNSIGDEGAKAISEALATNQSLTSLEYAPP